MRTPTITAQRRIPARISGLGLATVAVLALAACGGGGSSKKSGTTGGNPSAAAPSPAASSVAQADPAAGPVQDPATLPKSCNGLVTDADIQLALGQPLAGGDYFTAYQPLPNINQTKRVMCQYGIVQNTDGSVGSSQLDVQVATYSDAKAAASRVAYTVGSFAGKQDKYEQVSVGGHPATYVTEGTDEVLVMYDGNRTFVVTVQASLAAGDQARKMALTLGATLYKHVTPPAGSASPPSAADPAVGSASGGPSDGQATPSDSGTPGTPSAGTTS